MSYRSPDPLLPRLTRWLQQLASGPGQRPEASQALWRAVPAYTDRNEGPGWRLDTKPLNGRDDWLEVRTTPTEVLRVWMIASGGQVEIYEVEPAGLEAELTRHYQGFEGWASFFSYGPGQGH